MDKIIPRLLKGFRDFRPEQQERRQYCIDILQEVFRKSGFMAIDTPILEYEDILLGKGGGDTDKQIYRFQDNGKRKVVMRYDLTVPFARFVAMNHHNLPTPFFRSQIGKVFRGENTQLGRYREFMQCDFDIIGLDHVSLDFSILQCIISSFNALKIGEIKIHISHRALLGEFLASKIPRYNLKSSEALIESLRIIDKMRKIDLSEILSLLQEIWDESTAKHLIDLATREQSNEDTLDKLKHLVGSDSESLKRLGAIYSIVKEVGNAEKIVVDPSITRGLDYYTGFVCETFVTGSEHIGSVCSGGRYNNLTQLFSDTQSPGVGASIGLDRLLAVMEASTENALEFKDKKVVITNQIEEALAFAHTLQIEFQTEGFSAHVYPSSQHSSRSLKHVFKYSEKLQADYLCIIGSDELNSHTISIKNQHTREQLSRVKIHDAIEWMKQAP